MIEAQLLLSALEALLNGPAQAGRTGQLGQTSSGRREDQVVGAILRDTSIAANQDPALESVAGDPRQRDARPLVEADSFRSLTSGMRLPRFGGNGVGKLRRIGLHQTVSG